MNPPMPQLAKRIVELEEYKQARIRQHGAALEEIKRDQIETYTMIGYCFFGLDCDEIAAAEKLLTVTGEVTQSNARAQQLVDTVIKSVLYWLNASVTSGRCEPVLMRNKFTVMQYGENYFRNRHFPRSFKPNAANTLFMVEAKVSQGAYITPLGLRAMAYYLSNLKAIQRAKEVGLESYVAFVTGGAA